jgi:hypothetical protein
MAQDRASPKSSQLGAHAQNDVTSAMHAVGAELEQMSARAICRVDAQDRHAAAASCADAKGCV